MATYQKKFWNRSGTDNRIFTRPRRAETIDLTDVRFLHTGVDTVRQLYKGLPKGIYYELEGLYRTKHGARVKLLGNTWKMGSGLKGGYRLLLQNADLGLVILFGAAHVPRKDKDGNPVELRSGPHLKIECSPHWLHERSAEQAQYDLDEIARELLETPEPSGVAIHLCVDFQGWKLPSRDDFSSRFVTRAHANMSVSEIDSLEFSGLSTISVIHGNCQTITYGKANAVQMQLYDKTAASEKSDSIQWWRSIWRTASGRTLDDEPYNDQEQVRRLEFRFHHSVVEQFIRQHNADCIDSETGEVVGDILISNYATLANHLNGLWRYGLNNNRLQHSFRYIDPFWQLLIEDVQFHKPIGPDALYKRKYKAPGEGSEVNVRLLLGNFITLISRRGTKAHQAWRRLKLEQAWPDIREYYQKRGFSPMEMWEDFEAKFIDRGLTRALCA